MLERLKVGLAQVVATLPSHLSVPCLGLKNTETKVTELIHLHLQDVPATPVAYVVAVYVTKS
jgi:hypothetical protein